jgi:hypothetical protein
MKATLAALVLFWAATGAVAQPNATRQQQCGAKLEQAQRLDMVQRVDRGRIVVGPTWFRVGFDAKEGFAETVSCFLVQGDPKMCANFDLIDWSTGKPVARYENCRLKPL